MLHLRLWIVLFVLGSSAFAQGANADLSLASFQTSLREQIQAVQSPSYNAATCSSAIRLAHQTLNENPWQNFSNRALSEHGAELIQDFWFLRWSLHQRLADVTPDCRNQLRDLFTRLRGEEDYLTEFAYSASILNPEAVLFQKEPVPILEKGEYEPNFMAPGADESAFKLHSGDLLLARGTSFISAVISRLSLHPSSFSHTVVWTVDPQTQEPGTVESYLNLGVKKFDYKYALRNENVRLAVYRPKDAALGARAAEVARSYGDLNLPYDFKMNFADKSAMSCMEVATSAYAEASQNKWRVPLEPSQIGLSNPGLLEKLQMKPGSLILPGDLEIDPRFELVLEWRDNRVIRDSRHKDAILSELFRWMDELHYDFHTTGRSFVAAYILRPASKTPLWPLIQKVTGAPSINGKMPAKTLGALTVLNDVGTLLLEKLREADRQHVVREGRPMTQSQLRQTLEQFRRQDYEKFRRHQTAEFHGGLRPSR